MSALDYRDQLKTAKIQFGQGLITTDQLYAAADAYINALKEFKARTKNKKLKIPSRGYIIRAI